MKNELKNLQVFLLTIFLSLALSFQSCKDDNGDDPSDTTETGYLKDREQLGNIPQDVYLFEGNPASYAPSISLDHLFPPIGDQGAYGTCVTWAAGYNLKTALNAIERGWSQNDLGAAANQTSPKDLWFAIPNDKKGQNCDGTFFEPALDALIAGGAANMSVSPYTNMGNCIGTSIGNSANKLANYRKIASPEAGMTVNNLKGYLNSGRPIVFGARLGDRFMTWSGSGVISSDTYLNPGMQHANHAMVLTGYDNSKNAFRVRNSWGRSWGDNGSIWVDYNFFVSNFCFAAFVAQNTALPPGTLPTLTGDDLLAESAVDIASTIPGFTRKFTYYVRNSGTNPIPATRGWVVVAMYYNAFNATDYNILFSHIYLNYGPVGAATWLDPAQFPVPIPGVGAWAINVDLNSGQNVGWDINYNMPPITGDYYLVLWVDALNGIQEVNEDNNFFFITGANGRPIRYVNGIVQNMAPAAVGLNSATSIPELFANTDTQTAVTPENPNAYNPDELRTMLLRDIKAGAVDAKMKAFRAKHGDSGNNIQTTRAK